MHDERLGRVLHGRYRVVERVAEGGMGVVYRGERLGLDRAVAIKFLRAVIATDDAARRRFAIEARAAGRTSHPNCVGVIDVGTDDGTPFLVMDFVEGCTLRAILDDEHPGAARALALARDVLAGLAHAHARGIVHRDLKPENILVRRDELGDHAAIVDFGLARFTDALAISQDVAIGTPSYMSPEQTLGLEVDARSDVYNAGVLLYELLVGRKPFRARDPFEVMRLHREAPVPSFDDVAPGHGIAPELEGVVRWTLAKDPAHRPRSAGELARALDDALAEARQAADDAPLDELLRAATPRRHGLAVAAVGVALAGAVAWWTLV